jgi:hypothetical protein
MELPHKSRISYLSGLDESNSCYAPVTARSVPTDDYRWHGTAAYIRNEIEDMFCDNYSTIW